MTVDRPFIYVFDADALTDGLSYNNLQVPVLADSTFFLRRVSGLPAVASRIQIRNHRGQQLFSAPSQIPLDYPLAPELEYEPGSAISFDLVSVLRGNNAYGVPGSVPNYYSQLCFQGIRRFSQAAELETPYRYYQVPQIITAQAALTWTGRIAPAYTIPAESRRFFVQVTDYDFELYRMSAVRQAPAGAWVPSVLDAKIMLYDAVGNRLMSAPVVDGFLNSCVANFNSEFPIPPLLYPVGSNITFDVTSLLVAANVPMTINVAFQGVWRKPC
jgi:hypothetical protein